MIKNGTKVVDTDMNHESFLHMQLKPAAEKLQTSYGVLDNF